MATRRSFFKYIGLAGGVETGGVVAAAAIIPDREKSDCVKKLDTTVTNLSFRQTYGERLSDPAPLSNHVFVHEPRYVPGTKKEVAVGMNVGPDGELYLKVNGKWRRIVTE